MEAVVVQVLEEPIILILHGIMVMEMNMVKFKLRSKRVKKALGLGVHHLVRFTMPSSSKRNWAIFEWCSDGSNFYACDNISTNYCINL